MDPLRCTSSLCSLVKFIIYPKNTTEKMSHKYLWHLFTVNEFIL